MRPQYLVKPQDQNFTDFFSKHGRRMTFKKGEIIIRSDNPPTGVYFIEDGYVRIYSITEDGESKLHIIYKPGEIFPLVWAVKSVRKNVYYEAMGNTTLLKVSKTAFMDFTSSTKNNMSALSERMANVFNIHIDRIDNLEITKSYPRLISRLLSLAKRFGEEDKETNTVIIKAPVTQNDIANSIAMTRETTSREISRLEKKSLISYKEHLIIINNLQKLKKELSEFYENRI